MKTKICFILCLLCITFVVSCDSFAELGDTELSGTVFWDTALSAGDIEFGSPYGEISSIRGPLTNFCSCSRITLCSYNGKTCTAKLYISDANIPQFTVNMNSSCSGVCSDTDYGTSVSLELEHSSSGDTLTVINGEQSRVFTMQGYSL